jgi:hypothetical protein
LGQRIQKIKFESTVIFLAVVGVALLMMWGNPVLTLVSFAVLFAAVYYTGYAYIPPVMLFIIFYHWVQIYTTIILANYLDKDVNDGSDNASLAVLLSLAGLVVMMIVYNKQLKKVKFGSLAQMKDAAKELSATNILILYIGFYFLTNFFAAIAFSVAGLTQIIFSLIQLKWALFCLFALVCILNKEKYLLLGAVVLIEFVAGLYSYFSSFKDVLFYIILVGFSFVHLIRIRQFIYAAILAAVLFTMSVFWQSIKSDYRSFLRGDTRAQQVNVESEEAYEKLIALSEKTEITALNSTIVAVLSRIGYTYHFRLVLDRIPAVIPHEDGALWGSNLAFIFTPRALNPNKGVLDASKKTNQYAGTNYATAEGGSSFSLGYFVEGYIDFGIVGMFAPILILSYILAFAFRYFVNTASPNLLLNYSIAYAMFMPFFSFESDAIFFTGRLVITIITFVFLKYFIIRWSLPFLRRINKN